MTALVAMLAFTTACEACGSDDDEEPAEDTRFVVGDATVTDPDSGLMWLLDAGHGPMTWTEAVDWAADLAVGGFDDWRLPSGEDAAGDVCNSSSPPGANCRGTEFATLYFEKGVTALSAEPFLNVGSHYWTATELPDDTSQAMSQHMIDGGQNPFDKTTTRSAWAVRTTSDDDVRALTVDGDVIVDSVQCLTWTRDANLPCTLGGLSTIQGECWFTSLESAENWAAGLDHAGSTDWRLTGERNLPDQSELDNLFYEILGNPPGGPLTNPGPFENVLAETDFTYTDGSGNLVTEQRRHDRYWITPSNVNPGREPSFDIDDQTYGDHFMTDGERLSVWAVRDGCELTP